jgi:polar amino acid transport system substrate-binding protein
VVLLGLVAALVVAGCGSDSKSESESDNAAAGGTSGCTPKYKAEGKEPGKLRVAAIQFPPYSSIKDGQLDGIDGDIIKGFAKAACLEVSVSETTFAAAVSSLTSDRADLAMGSLYPTKDRAKEVGISNPAYLDLIGLASKNGISNFKQAESEGTRVGSVTGYYFIPNLKKIFGDKLSLFPDNTKMYQALLSGRIDMTVDSYPPAAHYLKQRGKLDEYKVAAAEADPRFPGSGSGEDAGQVIYAVQKNEQALLDALNTYLDDIRADGQLAQILADWEYSKEAADPGPLKLL